MRSLLLTSLSFGRLRVALLFVGVFSAACLLPAQADTYWHLRAGQDLFATGHVPLVETYSHTARGLPWPNHEWLWQALSYALYCVGGMPLLTGAAALVSTAACALSYRLMRTPPAASFVLALLGIALASVVWALRPQVVSLFFLVALVTLLTRDTWWPIPPLFVLWANLHGAVALGGVILLTATTVSWFCDRRRTLRLALLTMGCGLLTAATPMGPGLWRFIGESMARSRRNQIMEWMPSYPRGPIEIAFWVGAVALVALVAWRWRRLKSWDDRLVVAVSLVLLPLGARAVRNISPFFLLWMPAVSRLLGADFRWPRPNANATARTTTQTPSSDHPVVNAALLAIVGIGAIVAIAVAWRAPAERLGWRPIAPDALAAVRACQGPLYNRYNEGGYLIWFAPTVPVFIDSRQDPYPADLLTAHTLAERTGDATTLFAAYNIACTFLPASSRVAKRLTDEHWLDRYRDADWVVQSRPVTLPAR